MCFKLQDVTLTYGKEAAKYNLKELYLKNNLKELQKERKIIKRKMKINKESKDDFGPN